MLLTQCWLYLVVVGHSTIAQHFLVAHRCSHRRSKMVRVLLLLLRAATHPHEVLVLLVIQLLLESQHSIFKLVTARVHRYRSRRFCLVVVLSTLLAVACPLLGLRGSDVAMPSTAAEPIVWPVRTWPTAHLIACCYQLVVLPVSEVLICLLMMLHQLFCLTRRWYSVCCMMPLASSLMNQF